ncbi:MAG: hypothetical protein R3C32_02375 [Chloroflexota bacterium]
MPDGLDPASVTVDGLLPMAANDDGPVALGPSATSSCPQVA